jgi:hypothetical protein
MLAIVGQDNLKKELKLSSPSKISKKPGNAFSLPAGSDFSCAGETDSCRDACYAKHGRHVFANVQNLQAANWAQIKEFQANNDTKGAVKAFLDLIPEKKTLMRIHESGDFFSQWYVDVWEEVIRSRKNTNFWFYTRCFQFDFSGYKGLQNVACWASTDKDNEKLALNFVQSNAFFRHAWGPLAKDEAKANTVMCPVTTGKLAVDGACDKCRLCVERNRFSKNIGFVEH